MSDGMTRPHDAMLDDVAVYALGAMNAADAARVREHIETCSECRAEYLALSGTVATLATSVEDEHVPSDLLKARIMREIRAAAPVAEPARARRTIVWPAYLVAAACFAVAVALSISNLSLLERVKTAQTQVAQMQARETGLSRDLLLERSTLADVMDESARRYASANAEVVSVHDRVYITMHDLGAPPKGKVYQAWTLPKGAKKMVPSLTFVPDSHGVAVVSLPVNGAATAAVAVSVEPDGGSKQPTSKPVLVQALD
jgi:anti-sigma-K factor RskA